MNVNKEELNIILEYKRIEEILEELKKFKSFYSFLGIGMFDLNGEEKSINLFLQNKDNTKVDDSSAKVMCLLNALMNEIPEAKKYLDEIYSIIVKKEAVKTAIHAEFPVKEMH